MEGKLKVLIVEDDPVMQLVVQKKLDTTSIEHHTVNNGTEAIEALKTKRYDFVLMDIAMPQQDGLDTIRWIRDSKDEYNKNIPVFALTTYSTPEHTEEILEAGMNGHLVKPFDLTKFFELLKKQGIPYNP
jgi:two-component system, sensor histidine kinase